MLAGVAAGQHGLQRRGAVGAVLWRTQRGYHSRRRLADRFIDRPAGEGVGSRIQVQNPAAGIGDDHRVGDRLQEAIDAGQCLFCHGGVPSLFLWLFF